MQSGRLRERIAIQVDTPVQDSYGQEVPSWSTENSVWGQVISGAISERFRAAAGQRASEVSHTVRIRFRTDITPKKRLVWETRILEILGYLDPNGKRETLVIMCKEEQLG